MPHLSFGKMGLSQKLAMNFEIRLTEIFSPFQNVLPFLLTRSPTRTGKNTASPRETPSSPHRNAWKRILPSIRMIPDRNSRTIGNEIHLRISAYRFFQKGWWVSFTFFTIGAMIGEFSFCRRSSFLPMARTSPFIVFKTSLAESRRPSR